MQTRAIGVARVLALVTAVTASTRDAWADSAAFDLDYVAPADCASADAFVSAVQERLADRQVASADRRQFRVRIAHDRGQYIGALETSAASSTRDVTASTCDEVVRALVVFVALAVSPSDDEHASSPPPPPAGQETSPITAPLALDDAKSTTAAILGPSTPTGSSRIEAPPPAPPRPSRSPPSSPHVGVGVRGVVATGVAPGLAPGGAIDVGIELAARPRLRWLLHTGALVTYREAPVLDGAFSFTWAAGRVDVGPAFDVGRFRFGVGPVAHAGVLAVNARNLPAAGGDTTSWSDVGGFARVDHALSRAFGLSLMLELAVPIQRKAFGVRGVDAPVQQTPPVFGVLSLGVTVGP